MVAPGSPWASAIVARSARIRAPSRPSPTSRLSLHRFPWNSGAIDRPRSRRREGRVRVVPGTTAATRAICANSRPPTSRWRDLDCGSRPCPATCAPCSPRGARIGPSARATDRRSPASYRLLDRSQLGLLRGGAEVCTTVNAITPEQLAIAHFWADDPGTTATPPGRPASTSLSGRARPASDAWSPGRCKSDASTGTVPATTWLMHSSCIAPTGAGGPAGERATSERATSPNAGGMLRHRHGPVV